MTEAIARHAVLDHVPNGCAVLAEDGTVVHWNSVLEAWTGLSRSVVLGRDVVDVLPRLGEPRFRARVEQTSRLGLPAVFSALLSGPILRRKDDRGPRYEQVTVARLGPPHGERELLVTVVDITDSYRRGEWFRHEASRAAAQSAMRRARERELLVAKEAAEAATRAKSLFLAAMSHELRTPMNGVLGMCDLLLGSPLSPWHREHLEILQRSASSLLTILNDVLDLSKIEAQKLELEALPFDPRAVVEESVVLVAEMANAKDIECVSVVAPEVPRAVIGDAVRFRQVLMNLLSNAVKFTSSGAIVVSLGVEPCREGVHLVCAVKDSGPGISQAAQRRLFQPFVQAEAATSRLYGGTGLGLSICRKLVVLMGGAIELESEEGVGSTFRFNVVTPLAPGEQPPQRGRSAKVAILVSSEAAAESIAASCRSAGATVAESVVADALPAADCTHVIVDAAVLARVKARGGSFGSASVVVAARSSAARRPPPEGARAMLAVPSTLAAVEALLGEDCARDLAPPSVAVAPRDEASLGMRILVAEDDTTNQIVARAVLKRMGCEVTVVETGAAAVDAAMAGAHDVVLMDMQMPEMDGCEATIALRARGYTAPIVALTASALAEQRDACFEAGMNEVLTKPLDRRALLETLRRFRARDRAA